MKMMMMSAVTLIVGAAAVLTMFASTAEAQCNGDIRLVGGTNSMNGRLEIYDQGYWKTVCSKRLNAASATTICRQLGYTAGVLTFSPPVSPTSAPIWPYVIKCDGTESLLADCWRHREYDETCCAHQHDVGIVCTTDYIAPTTLPTPPPQDCRLDLALLIDSSGSIEDFQNMKNVARYIIDGVGSSFGASGVQVSVIEYSRIVTVEFYLNRFNNKADILNHITAMDHNQHETNLNGALYELWSQVMTPGHGARSGVPKVAVLITDGEDNIDENGADVINPPATIANAHICKAQGIRLMAVDVYTNPEAYNFSKLLEIVSSPPSINLYRHSLTPPQPPQYKQYQQAPGIEASIQRPQCVNDRNYCASGPCMNGATCYNEVNSYRCECASQYSGTRCQTYCWYVESGYHMNGGTYASTQSLVECQERCVQFAGCSSVDYRLLTGYHYCYLHGSWSTSGVILNDAYTSGYNHYTRVLC